MSLEWRRSVPCTMAAVAAIVGLVGVVPDEGMAYSATIAWWFGVEAVVAFGVAAWPSRGWGIGRRVGVAAVTLVAVGVAPILLGFAGTRSACACGSGVLVRTLGLTAYDWLDIEVVAYPVLMLLAAALPVATNSDAAASGAG